MSRHAVASTNARNASKPSVQSLMNPWFAAPEASAALATPVSSAILPRICGCTYRSAILDPKKRLLTSEGTLKLTNPTSLRGLITTTLPRRRLRSRSVRISLGWLLAGLPPMTNIRSASSASSSETVAVPDPVTLASPTPLAWWQKNEQLLTLLVPYSLAKSCSRNPASFDDRPLRIENERSARLPSARAADFSTASSHEITRYVLSPGAAYKGSTSRPLCSSSRGENRESMSKSNSSKKSGRMRPAYPPPSPAPTSCTPRGIARPR